MNRRNWNQDEDLQLIKIVHQVGQNDWPAVAHLLQHHSNNTSSRRSGKQCRQRWYNQLNPSIRKDQWTEEEEKMLFEVQKNYGNKWKQISRFLPGRTDNDIKNKFYSTLRRSLRRLNKLIGGKNSTGQIREIKPSVLSTIINFVYANENIDDQIGNVFKTIPQLIFKFSTFKPVRRNMNNAVENEVKENIDIIFKLLEQFKSYEEKTQKNDQFIPSFDEIEQSPKIFQKLPQIKEQPKPQERFVRIVYPIITIEPQNDFSLMKEPMDKKIQVKKQEESSNEMEGDLTGVLIMEKKKELEKGLGTQVEEKKEEIIENH